MAALKTHPSRTPGLVARRKLLWVADTPVPQNVRQAARDAWDLTPYLPDEPLRPQMNGAPLALVCPNGDALDAQRLGEVLAELERSSAVGVFLLARDAQLAWKLLAKRAGQYVCVPVDASAVELAAKFACAADLQPAIHNLRTEMRSVADLHDAAAGSFHALTEEIRLAARLQRDFLPRRLPEVGPVRFGVLFRPASWVSGDIYDITRLDETHVGFYVADAVGHGLPAALLTMFIKKALQTKRIFDNAYQIVPPHVSLQELNSDICRQNLSSCQFCTAVYCVLDAATLTLTCARAGHPEPVILHADGTAEKVTAPGSLLGVLPEETYQAVEVRLSPGDRVVLYSDGAEFALLGTAPGGPRTIDEALREWSGVPREEMILQLSNRIDETQTKDHLDDVTVMVVDVAR